MKLASIIAVAVFALGAQADPVIVNNYIQVVPSTPAPTPAPEPAPVPARQPWDFIETVWYHYSNYDSDWLTEYTQNWETNYFGRLHASNTYICSEMGRDATRFSEWRATYYPETFTHEVSTQYSTKWEGPMIYDNITMRSDVYETGVRWHHAMVRFTVGYTYVSGVVKIYALVYKVV